MYNSLGSVQYLNSFGIPHYGNFGGLPPSIASVMDAQKKMLGTDQGWGIWVGSAIAGIKEESGKNISTLMYFIDQGKGASVSERAKLFGRLKAKAQAYDAPETAKKIEEGAEWFYYNVEGGKKPSSGSSSSGGSSSGSTPSTYQPSFFEQYQIPIYVGGGVIALGGLFFILRKMKQGR